MAKVAKEGVEIRLQMSHVPGLYDLRMRSNGGNIKYQVTGVRSRSLTRALM